MNWKRCVFLKHYKKITVEGNDTERLINLCLIKKLNLRKIRFISDREVSFYVSYDDYEVLRETVGRRYRIIDTGEYGYRYRMSGFLKKKTLVAGLLIFSLILIYQSLFVAEIEVLGYESINEQALRKTMRAAGFYEGCRKSVNLEKVKLHIYDEFDNISWIGIKYKGNLAQITIAETEYLYENKRIDSSSPCNIIAATAGYVNSIDPEEGVRIAEDGAYVKEGQVLISGEVPLEKTTFEDNDKNENVSYVHAAGTVDAKVPVRLNYYIEANEKIKEKTGKRMFTVAINDRILLNELCPYEVAVVHSITLCNWVKPIRFKLQVNSVEEVVLKEEKIAEKDVRKQVINEIHKFVKEKLPDNTQILNKSLNFRQEKNIIYIGVTLETLQQIGIEEEIIVDKSNRQSDQNDDK